MIINKYDRTSHINNLFSNASIPFTLPENFGFAGARDGFGIVNPSRKLLSLYVHNGHWVLVDDLLSTGVDINAKDFDGRTVLHEVAAIGSPQAVVELKKRGAVLDVQDENKRAPLHYAVSKGSKQLAVVEQLLCSGAQINITDKQGRTPAHYTVISGDTSIIECLSKHHADLNKVDARGQTPLQFAVENNAINIVDTIVKMMKQHQDSIQHRQISQSPFSFYASRRLYYVFGGHKLKSSMSLNNQQSNGGTEQESTSFLVTCLATFIADKKSDQRADYETILNTLKSSCENINKRPEDLATQVMQGIPVLLHAGYVSHAIKALFYKQEEKIILSIMDRGALTQTIPNTENCHSIRRIEIPEHLLIWTICNLKRLKSNDITGEKTAKFLFTELPKVAQSKYQSDDELQQKLSKDELCYLHANKTALLELLAMQFGKLLGHQIYKEITLHAREKALESYQINVNKNFDPNCDQVKEECHRIIEQKKAKLIK